jgi:hypothetical protein
MIGPRKIGPSTPLIPWAGLEVNAGESKRERLTTKKVFEHRLIFARPLEHGIRHSRRVVH